MALSAFDDKSRPPSDADVRAVLGRVAVEWRALLDGLAERFPPIRPAWGFTSRSAGWGMRIHHGERIVLYMTPCRGHFLVSLALGEKAVTAARAKGMPEPLRAIVDGAPIHAEGRGVRFEVNDATGVRWALALADAKMAG